MKSNLKRSLAFILAISITLSLCIFNAFAEDWVLSEKTRDLFETLYNSADAINCAESESTTKMIYSEGELYILGEGDATTPDTFFSGNSYTTRILCVNIGPDVTSVPSLYSKWFDSDLWGQLIAFAGTTRRVFHIYGENTVLKDISLEGLNCSSYTQDYIRFVVNPKNTDLIERLRAAGYTVIEAQETGTDGSISWKLDYLNHKLVIDGSGDMPKHLNADAYQIGSLDELAPWNSRLYDTYIGNFKNTMKQSLRPTYMINEVEISNAITSIAPFSFYGVALSDVQFPTMLKEIGASAFSNYDGWKYENNQSTLYAKRSTVTSLSIPEHIEKVGEQAFGYWNLETLNLPEANISVGTEAFNSTSSYFTVNCEAKTQNISIGAFSKSKLQYKEPHEGIAIISQQNETLKAAALQANMEVQFFDEVFTYSGDTITGLTDYGKTLSDITIPSTSSDGTIITMIGQDAFDNCMNVKTVYIDSNITKIGSSAFSDTQIETITINEKSGSVSGEPWGATSTTEVIWLVPSSISISGSGLGDSFTIKGGETWEEWLNSAYGNGDKIKIDENNNVLYSDMGTWKFIRRYSGAPKQKSTDVLTDDNSFFTFTLSSMTIDGTPYYFEPNTQWYSWTYSEDNTDGFFIDGAEDSVFKASNLIVTKEDGSEVSKMDYIEDGGTYITVEIESDTSKISISGVEYVIEDGMTWDTWLLSSYNTGGFYSYNGCVFNSEGAKVIDLYGNEVYTSYSLYNGNTFSLRYSSITIDAISYYIIDGQTWADWLESSNNTASFYSDGSYVRSIDGGYVAQYGSQVGLYNPMYNGNAFTIVPSTLTFYINDVSYQANAFSNFYDWLQTGANTLGLKSSGNNITDANGKNFLIDPYGNRAGAWATIENEGRYILREPENITFTIDGKVYNAVEFDDFYAWIASNNNTDSFKLGNNSVVKTNDETKVLKDSSSAFVHGYNTLQNGAIYTTYQPQSFVFFIDNVPYTFKELQTLQEWVNSENNTDAFTLTANNYVISQNGSYVCEYGSPTYCFNGINANQNYTLLAPSNITISIDGVPYQAKQYQSLSDWTKSEYNTLNLKTVGNYIKSKDGLKVLFRENDTNYPLYSGETLNGNESFILKTSDLYQIFIDDIAYQYPEYISIKEWVNSEYNVDALKLIADDTNAGENEGSGNGDVLFLATSDGRFIERSNALGGGSGGSAETWTFINENFILEKRNDSEHWKSKAASQPSETGIWNYVDDVEVQFPDVQPRIIDGEIVSPIRFIFNDLGAEVYWNQDEQKVTIRKEENGKKVEIVMKPGATSMWVNGAEYTNTEIGLDATVLVENGRCLLPGRAIIKAWETVQFKAVHKEPTSYKDYYYKTSEAVEGGDSKLENIPTIDDWQETNPGTKVTEDNETEVFKPSDPSSSDETQIIVDAEITLFRVYAPIRINGSMKKNGAVVIEGDYKIENKCALGPVLLTDVKVTTASDWKVADFDADFANMKANSKTLGMAINGAKVGENGRLIMNDDLSSAIGHQGSKELTFEMKLPAQRRALHEVAAAVVFTFAFDTV